MCRGGGATRNERECHRQAGPHTEQCVAVHDHHPEACRSCGGTLAGNDPEPLRHQVWDLPEIKPVVTEHRRHRLTCPGCGTVTCGTLPPDVPQGQAGPQLMAVRPVQLTEHAAKLYDDLKRAEAAAQHARRLARRVRRLRASLAAEFGAAYLALTPDGRLIQRRKIARAYDPLPAKTVEWQDFAEIPIWDA